MGLAVNSGERDEFLDAVTDVVPLEPGQRDRVRVSPLPTKRVRSSTLPSPVPLTIEDRGARAPGISRAQLATLRRGGVHVEATLDLHGHDVARAEIALADFLLDSARLGRRCVLVIHGRGLHSGGVAVLRDAVIGALTGSLSGLVRAFVTAAPRDGGEGATYVMVRSDLSPPSGGATRGRRAKP
jgi:DNA-nicking Smr family endonuclease